MANETPTPMDNKELPMIKYLKDIKAASERTGDLVKNESTANSIIASALPEVLNDTRLYYARETLDTRQGLFEIDDYLRAILLQDAKYYGGGVLMESSLKDLVKSTNDLKPLFKTISDSTDDMANEVTESITDNKKEDLTQAQRKEKAKEEYMKQTEGEKKTAGYFKGLGDKFDGFKKSFIGKLLVTDLILVGILLAIAYFRPLAETIERFFRTTGQLFRGEIGFFEYIGDNFILMGGIALVLFRKTLGRFLARVLLGGTGKIGFFAQLGIVIEKFFTKGKVIANLSSALGGLGRGLKFLLLGLGRLAGIFIAIPLAIFGFIKGYFKGFNRELERSEDGFLGVVRAIFFGILQGLYNGLYTVLDFFTFGFLEAATGAVEDFDVGQWVQDIFAAIVYGVVDGITAMGDSIMGIFTNGLPEFSLTDNAITDFFGGGRAEGGDVKAGVNYMVGEKGPEMFSPRTSGTIIPNGMGMGGATTNINNFTTVNANNNSSRSDTTVSNRSVDNTGYGSQNAGLT